MTAKTAVALHDDDARVAVLRLIVGRIIQLLREELGDV